MTLVWVGALYPPCVKPMPNVNPASCTATQLIAFPPVRTRKPVAPPCAHFGRMPQSQPRGAAYAFSTHAFLCGPRASGLPQVIYIPYNGTYGDAFLCGDIETYCGMGGFRVRTRREIGPLSGPRHPRWPEPRSRVPVLNYRKRVCPTNGGGS